MKYLKPTIAGLIAWLAIIAMSVFVFFAGGFKWGTDDAGTWAFFSMLFSSLGAAMTFIGVMENEK